MSLIFDIVELVCTSVLWYSPHWLISPQNSCACSQEPRIYFTAAFCLFCQLVNLGKSITDFSAEGDEEASKEDLEKDDDHDKLDEEMGENVL